MIFLLSEITGSLLARMKRKRLPISRHGAALAGGALVLLMGGMLLGDGLLMLLGFCAIVFLVSSGVLAWLSLYRLKLSVHLPKRVSAGREFDFDLTLHNRRSVLDAFQVQVEVILPGKVRFIALAPWTAAGSASRLVEPVLLPSRGYADVHAARISTTFPLGLFSMSRSIRLRCPIVVTPRPIQPMELQSDGALHDAQPRGGVTIGQSFGEPRGIRPWQAGDSARRIHWPASARAMARGHDLRVREYDPPGFHPDHCHLVFHSYASGGEMLREDRFERAVSLLTGSLTSMQANGIPCVLTADFNDWHPVSSGSRLQLVECLSQLARVQRNKGTEAHDLEQTLRAVSPDHALVIISDMPPDSWSHLLAKHPHTLIIDIRQIRYRHKTLHATAPANN